MLVEFERQARIFRETNHRPAVLVLDDISHLAEKDPRRLNELRIMAEKAALDRLFITVFVSSGEQPMAEMKSKFFSYPLVSPITSNWTS